MYGEQEDTQPKAEVIQFDEHGRIRAPTKGRTSFNLLEKSYAQGYVDGSAERGDAGPVVISSLKMGLAMAGFNNAQIEQVVYVLQQAFHFSKGDHPGGPPKCSREAIEWARAQLDRGGNSRVHQPKD